jgi:hypothetical protein
MGKERVQAWVKTAFTAFSPQMGFNSVANSQCRLQNYSKGTCRLAKYELKPRKGIGWFVFYGR